VAARLAGRLSSPDTKWDLAKGIEDETCEGMIRCRVTWVIEDSELRPFVQSVRTPTGLSRVGLLVESYERVLDAGYVG